MLYTFQVILHTVCSIEVLAVFKRGQGLKKKKLAKKKKKNAF